MCPLQIGKIVTSNNAATVIGGYFRVSFDSSGWSPYLRHDVTAVYLQKVLQSFVTTGIVQVTRTTLDAPHEGYGRAPATAFSRNAHALNAQTCRITRPTHMSMHTSHAHRHTWPARSRQPPPVTGVPVTLCGTLVPCCSCCYRVPTL